MGEIEFVGAAPPELLLTLVPMLPVPFFSAGVTPSVRSGSLLALQRSPGVDMRPCPISVLPDDAIVKAKRFPHGGDGVDRAHEISSFRAPPLPPQDEELLLPIRNTSSRFGPPTSSTTPGKVRSSGPRPSPEAEERLHGKRRLQAGVQPATPKAAEVAVSMASENDREELLLLPMPAVAGSEAPSPAKASEGMPRSSVVLALRPALVLDLVRILFRGESGYLYSPHCKKQIGPRLLT